MDFSLSEEQKILVKTLEKFAKNELLPEYSKWDREDKFPYSQWNKMTELGLPGISIPVEFGGQEADSVTMGLVIEEIAKGDFNCAFSLILQILNVEILKNSASDKIKAEWLPKVSSGEKLLGLAITEPNCGTDAGALKTKAVKNGNKYVLNGEKSGVSFTGVAHAFLLFARTSGDDARGVSAFIVPMDLPGITIRNYQDLGEKPVKRGSIFLEDVEIPEEYLIGSENKAFKEIMMGFDLSRVLLGLACLGAAQITLEETINYVKERHAFKQPLAKFEGVSFPIAEHVSKIESVRRLSYYSLWLRDQGLPHAKEAAMCKWMGPQFSFEAIHECLLMHGHYGYTQEFPVEQRLRDVIGLEIGDGTANVSKIVISRELFGRDYLPY